MKYMEHEGFTFMHNGISIRIINNLTKEEIWVSRHILQTALDFSEDIE